MKLKDFEEECQQALAKLKSAVKHAGLVEPDEILSLSQDFAAKSKALDKFIKQEEQRKKSVDTIYATIVAAKCRYKLNLYGNVLAINMAGKNERDVEDLWRCASSYKLKENVTFVFGREIVLLGRPLHGDESYSDPSLGANEWFVVSLDKCDRYQWLRHAIDEIARLKAIEEIQQCCDPFNGKSLFYGELSHFCLN
jgi:hypothetical protein